MSGTIHKLPAFDLRNAVAGGNASTAQSPRRINIAFDFTKVHSGPDPEDYRQSYFESVDKLAQIPPTPPPPSATQIEIKRWKAANTPKDTTNAFVIDNLLTSAECSYIIKTAAPLLKPMDDEYESTTRDASRAMIMSPTVADQLFKRIVPHLDKERDYLHRTPLCFGHDGVWAPLGLNECLKIFKYESGRGGFAAHRDGPWVPKTDECSMYTIVIYLNTVTSSSRYGCNAGETVLYGSRDDFVPIGGRDVSFGSDSFIHSGSSSAAADDDDVGTATVFGYCVKPRQGRALIFNHDCWHGGEPTRTGEKHILRTELIFKRIFSFYVDKNSFSSSEAYLAARRLYDESMKALAEGDRGKFFADYQRVVQLQRAAMLDESGHRKERWLGGSAGDDENGGQSRRGFLGVDELSHIMSFLPLRDIPSLLRLNKKTFATLITAPFWQDAWEADILKIKQAIPVKKERQKKSKGEEEMPQHRAGEYYHLFRERVWQKKNFKPAILLVLPSGCLLLTPLSSTSPSSLSSSSSAAAASNRNNNALEPRVLCGSEYYVRGGFRRLYGPIGLTGCLPALSSPNDSEGDDEEEEGGGGQATPLKNTTKASSSAAAAVGLKASVALPTPLSDAASVEQFLSNEEFGTCEAVKACLINAVQDGIDALRGYRLAALDTCFDDEVCPLHMNLPTGVRFTLHSNWGAPIASFGERDDDAEDGGWEKTTTPTRANNNGLTVDQRNSCGDNGGGAEGLAEFQSFVTSLSSSLEVEWHVIANALLATLNANHMQLHVMAPFHPTLATLTATKNNNLLANASVEKERDARAVRSAYENLLNFFPAVRLHGGDKIAINLVISALRTPQFLPRVRHLIMLKSKKKKEKETVETTSLPRPNMDQQHCCDASSLLVEIVFCEAGEGPRRRCGSTAFYRVPCGVFLMDNSDHFVASDDGDDDHLFGQQQSSSLGLKAAVHQKPTLIFSFNHRDYPSLEEVSMMPVKKAAKFEQQRTAVAAAVATMGVPDIVLLEHRTDDCQRMFDDAPPSTFFDMKDLSTAFTTDKPHEKEKGESRGAQASITLLKPVRPFLKVKKEFEAWHSAVMLEGNQVLSQGPESSSSLSSSPPPLTLSLQDVFACGAHTMLAQPLFGALSSTAKEADDAAPTVSSSLLTVDNLAAGRRIIFGKGYDQLF